jgi:hypothetical protein
MSSKEDADFVPEWIRGERAKRDELRQRYAALLDEISAALFEVDPIGINFGDNSDEYDAEAGTILPHLRRCSDVEDVQAVVYLEFVRWFGAEIAGDASRYRDAAERIWKLWSTTNREQKMGD